MTKSVAYCTLIVAGGLVIAVSLCSPGILSDSNRFLREFLNHEFLGLLGVILAITLASAAQIHLAMNRVEERYRQSGGLGKTRAGVKSASQALIFLFVLGVLVVVIKPIIATEPWQQSLFNGAALFVVLWNVLLLISITRTVFAIKPIIDDEH
jgi:Trk-type K+ transport system membrane component